MSLKKKKEEEFSVADSIINGTWDDGSLNVDTSSQVANTVNTLNNVSNNIKQVQTTMSLEDKDKEKERLYDELITSKTGDERQKGIQEYNKRIKKLYGDKTKQDTQNRIQEYNDKVAKSKGEKTSKEKAKEQEENNVLSAFKDGYNFGDVTKTIGKVVDKKIVDPAYEIGEALEKDPKTAIKTIVPSIQSGFENTDRTLDRALQDFSNWITGREKDKSTGIQNMNVNDYNRLVQSGTPEEKQVYLDQLNEDLNNKKINKDVYNLYKDVLTTEDNRNGFEKAVGNFLDPDYQQSEMYQKYASGELTPGEEKLWQTGEQIGTQLPAIMASSLVTPAIGSGLFWTQAQQNYTEEAKQRGYKDSDARKYGLLMGTVESVIERLGFDELGGLSKMSKDSIFRSMAGESMEEFVTPYIDYGARWLFGEKYNLDAATNEALDGAISAAVTSAIMSGASKGLVKVDNVVNKVNKGQQITSQELSEAAKEIQKENPEAITSKINTYLKTLFENNSPAPQLMQQETQQLQEQPQIPTQAPINTLSSNIQEQNNQILGQEQTPQITPLNQVNQELQETRQNDIANQVQAMNLEQTPEFTQKQGNYVYEKSDNSKVDNLRKDAANYLKEGEQTTNFVNTLEKLVKDKDIEIRFDTKLGNNVNGTYKNGVITINPNSNRAGEFVAIHELTHAIGTKPMIDMIQTYRKSNAEFNNAVERLLSTYKTTEINEEALGDIAGQLFGNQEYINNLSMENPSLFKKIYNEIKYLWHQFTGYKNQNQFIEDLRNKWESAYRNNVAKKGTRYSYSINESIPLKESNTGKELSKEQQQFFKDTKVRDNDGNLITVYHTTTNAIDQFNEFNPVGTDYYKFGDQVVNYYTNSKDMSGSYANQDYVMADTSKITSMDEVNKLIEEHNNNLNIDERYDYNVGIIKDGDGYKLKVTSQPGASYSGVTEEFYPRKYKNDIDLFKRIKNDLKNYRTIRNENGRALSNNHKIQYEGYVNITNPYIVDAEKRNWNQVVSQSNNFIDELDERVPQDIKNNLTRLYQESENKSAEAREKYSGLQDMVNHVRFTKNMDENIQKTIEVAKRVGINELEDALEYDGQMGIIGVNGWYKLAEELETQGIIGESTAKLIIDDFKLPEQVKETIKKYYNEPIDRTAFYLDFNSFKKSFGEQKKVTLKEIFKKDMENYEEFDKYRMPNSYFLEELKKDGNDYLGYDLEDMFETRAEVMGADTVADEISQAASVGFSKPEMIRLWGTSKTTNDVVKEVIASNKDGKTNYDGVIIKNVYDYGGYTDEEKNANDLYITFNSNQFKNIDNTNPTEDPDIRYSKDNQTWREYLEKEFPSQGTRTNLQDINERNKSKQENKTTQEEKPQEMPKNEVKQEVKKSYLTSAEQNELDGLKAVENSGFAELTKEEQERMEELEKKSQGITKKFPELKKTVTQEDTKPLYFKYKDNEISRENNKILNEAKNIVESNKQGRRTKEQWLQVAEYIGSNADIKNSTDLQKLAMETWLASRPNIKDNLNRQGNKYVDFKTNEWFNAMYKGAGVGTDLGEITGRKKPKKVEDTTKQEKPQETPKNPVADSVRVMNLEKENIKYSAEEKIEKSVRNQYKGLSEDKIQQIIELKEEQKEKDKMYSNFSNKQRAKQRIMINAYETNAKIRKIVQGDSLGKVKGGLTDTELAKAIEKEDSNYIGKKVIVDGQNGTVIGNPYGRVKIKFEDGTIKTVDKSDVKSINESKQDDVVMMKATDTKGNKVDLKPTGNNVYERVNVKSTKNQVIPDMSNKVLNIGNEKVSNFYSNITEKSKFITEENREALKDNANLQYYDAITNKDTLESAMDKLNKNPEQQTGDFFAKKEFTPEDVATGWILVKRYQDAGNYEAMSNVIEKMREQGTKAGQTVQMYGILQRLTPEGMEYYSQKQLDNAFKKFSEGKSKQKIDQYAPDFTLTAEEHQFIKDTMEKVQNMTDEEQKKVEIAKIVAMLNKKIPPEKGQRLKAWMRIAMLGNPKTQVRNVAGNAIIQPVNWVGDVFSATADKIISKKTGKRTIGTTDFGALVQGTKKGFKDAVRDAKTGVDTRDINLDRFEENIGANPFYEKHEGAKRILNPAAKVLNKTNRILGNIMSGGDRIFYQAVYDNSLQNQMKLNKVDKPTQEMMDIAEQEALSRTWNDSNSYTKSVLQIRNAMNKLNVKGYGLGDVLVPFAKTPANLTKAIVDYSPVGLTRTILSDGKKLRNSLENGQYNAQLQHQFADSFGKGVAGTILWTAAYALAKAGITSGKSDDDKDVANFMRNTLGIQPYSIKIGDKSFTYDWAQPIAAPFAAMADYQSLTDKEKKDLGSTIEKMTSSASNILLEQSFLSSIQDVFNSYEGPAAAIKQQIQDLPARATPTFFKQIADLIDPTSRQTFVKGDTKETMKNKVQVKIPGKSKELVEQRDTLGREIKKYGGDEDKLKYAFNVFLNPANTNKGKKSEAAEEIYNVYKATGDRTIMPRQIGYSEMISGKSRNLTPKERSEWQKRAGQKVEENIKTLSKNPEYKGLSNEDKATVISNIVNYSFSIQKEEMFKAGVSNLYKKAYEAEQDGIPIADFYLEKMENYIDKYR